MDSDSCTSSKETRDPGAPRGPLAGVRVLDLAARPGAFAARLLGDLGADVIKIEPPGGDPLRALGPFWCGEPHPDRSLAFWFYNTGKRSVTLDLQLPGDRLLLTRLAQRADVLIETGRPGQLEHLGLGYEALARQNDGLVLVSITPFGQTGPHREWQTSALVTEAVSGMLFVNGFPDEAPIATPGTQAYHSAGAYAAIATLAALLARTRTGKGQWIDMSLQEATATAVEHVAPFFHQIGRVHRRAGSLHWTRYFRVARCRDGYVLHCSLGDWTSLIEWVKADGKAQELGAREWEDFKHRRAKCVRLFDVLDEWVEDYAVADLMEGAQRRRIPYAAVRPPEALFDDPHLAERGFFVPILHEDIATSVLYPGPMFRMLGQGSTNGTPRCRPPHLGEHTDEILGECSRGSMAPSRAAEAAGASKRPGVTEEPSSQGVPRRAACTDASPQPATSGSDRPGRPLDGVRVLDFTWVVAGPAATKMLADLGAEVIKVERRDSLDFGDRRGGFTGGLNRGKLGTVINVSDARGLTLIRRIVSRVDFVIDNFSARVMRNWGLDYDGLRAIKSDIIAIGMSGFGHSGPYKDYVSYGPTLQALAGYTFLMRHPGREPAGFGFSYSDIVGSYAATLAALAALWHRRRTGQGQYIDLSQFEASCAVLGPLLLDIAANKRKAEPAGNASQEGPAAPHGVYRCTGEDRWCAIAVFGNAEWARLATALGDPPWTRDARFATLESRLCYRAALDGYLEAWTRQRQPHDVAERLQSAGVRAGVVADAVDLCERDSHLAARGYWVRVPTPEGGEVIMDHPPYRLDRTPAFIAAPGPLLGEHTTDVLRRILGLGSLEIAELRAANVIG